MIFNLRKVNEEWINEYTFVQFKMQKIFVMEIEFMTKTLV